MILLVHNNTINIMGRDVMDQMGLRLTMTEPNIKVEKKLLNMSNTYQRISKRIFTKYPHICTRLGRSKNHVAKSTFRKVFQPRKHKGRRIPFHLTEKSRERTQKINRRKTNQKTNKMLRRTLHKPSSHYS